MCDNLDACLRMFEGSGWTQCRRPDLSDCPIKCNPYKTYHVSTDAFETVIRTPAVIFRFKEGKLKDISKQ